MTSMMDSPINSAPLYERAPDMRDIRSLRDEIRELRARLDSLENIVAHYLPEHSEGAP